MKIKRLPIGILLVILASCLCCEVFAYVLSGSSWPDSEATIYSTGSSDSYWNNAFVQAMNNWNNLSNFTYKNASGYRDPCANPNNYGPPWYTGWEWSYDNCGVAFGTGVLAVNTSWTTGSTITQAGTVFNANLSWDVHSGYSADYYDFRRVATHELGHALGLKHANTSALMNSTYSESIEIPQTDDINGLRAIYGAGGTPGDYDYCSRYGPCSAGQGDCDGNAECQSGLTCVNDVGANYGYDAVVDVCESAGGTPMPETELLIGSWHFWYTIITKWHDYYYLNTISSDTNSQGASYVYGEDKYGNIVNACYWPNDGYWSLLDPSIIIDLFYVFYTNGNSILSNSCYYQITKSTGKWSTCYALDGYKFSSSGTRSLDIDLRIDENDVGDTETEKLYEMEILEKANKALYRNEVHEVIDDSILETYEEMKQLMDSPF